MCRNNCKEKFAKIYDLNNGWSDELPLPGLSPDAGNDCSLANVKTTFDIPQLAVNTSGDLIVANELATKISGSFSTNHHIASSTGDILSATSDNNCSTNPSSSSAGTNAGGNSGSSNDGSEDETSASSLSTQVLFFCLSFLVFIKSVIK